MNSLRPSRPPDLTISYISFWWDEKIQSNDYSTSVSDIYIVDTDKWRYQRVCDNGNPLVDEDFWVEYSGWPLFEENEKRIKDSYAKWAMEREFFES